LPPVGAISKHPARLCRPGRQASRGHPRAKPGFSTFESRCGRETDCLLEKDGFEPSVPAAGELRLSRNPLGCLQGIRDAGADAWRVCNSIQALSRAGTEGSKPSRMRRATVGILPALRRIGRIALYSVAGFIVGSIVLVALYRALPPPGTPLMLIRRVEGYGIDKSWRGSMTSPRT
jgi:hypothetical protein